MNFENFQKIYKIAIFFLCVVFVISCSSYKEYKIFEEYKQDAYNSITILGDTQRTSGWEFWRENNDEYRKSLFPAVVKEKPDAIVILGDLVFRGSSQWHWQEFEQNTQEARTNKITIYPLLGNHQYYGNNQEAFENYFQRFPYLKNSRWYDRKLSSCAFLFLDSNFGELSEEEIFLQNLWYLKKLKEYENSPEVKHIFVCCHHPALTNSTVISPSQEVKQHFLPAFLSMNKTRIFFSGHCHAYEHFFYEGKHFIVSGGGGGPRHTLNTNPSTRKYQDLFSGSEIRSLHYCKLLLDKSQLHFTMMGFDPDKKIWDRQDSFVVALNQELE
ncbi:MAG: metallophosphoesterase [Candidatus Brocadiae bacterium]|nr:metallophosphoesterase [Candidatus Brocadiia bacterium]